MKLQTTFSPTLRIGDRHIGNEHAVYFIADIAANHDGDLERAKELIYRAKEAGADAAKFQHFSATTIVSDYEFRRQQGVKSHQSTWKKSVFEVYSAASVDLSWTAVLKETCDKAGIEFMTSPYSYALAEHSDPYLNAYKIGSGDITWIDYLKYLAKKNKPLLLATGASTFEDVIRAVEAVNEFNSALCVMQCNTNYTGSVDNFKYLNLRVLNCYREMFPTCVLGLSDHTPGHSAVLGAVALGARVVEKHFTDSNERDGPDHKFSLTSTTWRAMVDATRELDYALGNGIKRVEPNERATVVVQRRSLCAARYLPAGSVLTADDLIPLRPCQPEAFRPYEAYKLIGRPLKTELAQGQSIARDHLA
ncbi:MAG: N-acetylneuraminate synthase [Actinobacteria bacterium]|nr:N-acetylneuraminate synthase [Actinomycetota bacterium]